MFLDFLRLSADPAWLSEDRAPNRAAGRLRIPRVVTELIYRLQDGWAPRLVLSPAQSVVWRGEPLPSSGVELVDGDELLVRGTCEPEARALLHERLLDGKPGQVTYESMTTTHLGGWTVDASPIGLRSVQNFSEFEFVSGTWHARREGPQPRLWVAEVRGAKNLPFGNLDVVRQDVLHPHERPWHRSSARMLGRLEGRYPYYLILTESKGSKSTR